jgi:hypothetical protein
MIKKQLRRRVAKIYMQLFGISRNRLEIQAKVLRVLADDGGGEEFRDVFEVLGLKLL